ncbi:hemicentin-2-like [Oratosquilla oratoria]|uniref:hemicentin-2-like n=1 Tax=Oratosquilla oratoria TaxID=337810 RepID=UPI003F7627C3
MRVALLSWLSPALYILLVGLSVTYGRRQAPIHASSHASTRYVRGTSPGGSGSASRRNTNTKQDSGNDISATSGSSNGIRISSKALEPIKPLLSVSTAVHGGHHGGTMAGNSATKGLTMPNHPVFDDAAPKNVSGLTGNAAYLHCVVRNLNSNSVSWIRRRDLKILTVGRYTYTTDQRFEVLHSEESSDWILKIKYAQLRDSGVYECQVSTKPPLSYTVQLNIFAPQAAIVGAPDMHVDKGSAINLTCVIVHSPQPPAYIFWYHNGKVVQYDSPRGDITVVTELGNVTRSFLLIKEAKPGDSGNYTCAPSNTEATTASVHVLNGKTPAAMQTSKGETPAAMQTPGGSATLRGPVTIIMVFSTVLLLLLRAPFPI